MNLTMTIGKRLATTCAVLIVLAACIAGVALRNISIASRSVATFAQDAIPGLYFSEEIQGDVFEFVGNCWKHIATSDSSIRVETERTNETLKKQIAESIHAYEGSINGEEDRVAFDTLRQALDRYYRAWDGVAPISREGRNNDAAAKYMSEAEPALENLHKSIHKLVEWNKQYGDHTASAAMQEAVSARIWTWSLIVATIVLGSFLTWFLMRSVRISLSKSLGELKEGAAQVASAASQVSSASQSLAQGSSEQAASLEETSASTEEINAVARKNADDCVSAADLVVHSQHRFEQANGSLEVLVTAVGEINASSEKISKIIRVIDEIAFQTNILALNAAVEAAGR